MAPRKSSQSSQSDDIRECCMLFKLKDNNKTVKDYIRRTEMRNKFPVAEQGKINWKSHTSSDLVKFDMHNKKLPLIVFYYWCFETCGYSSNFYLLVLNWEVGNLFYVKREITQGKGHIFAFLILALLMSTQWLFLPQTLTVYCAPVKVNSIGYQYARQWECINNN